MSKIIKIDALNSDLGKIFAEIEESSSKEIRIIYGDEINNLFSSNDINLIETYAEKQGKEVKFLSSEKVEKSGFVIGEDVFENPVVKTTTTKNKTQSFKFSKPNIKFHPALFIFFLLLVGAAAAAFYFFNLKYPKAQVFLTIKSQVYTGTQETNIVAGLDAVNIETNSIPGKEISVEASQEIIVIPTGEKDIGEKAIGKVKLYNKTNSDKKINKGTQITLTSKEDKEYIFITTADITVNKKTSGETVTDAIGDYKKADVYGTEKVEIEASEIGNNYNLAKDNIKNIKVSDYNSSDQVSAEIENEPDGGNSKKATVVLQKDLDDLKEKLVDKAKEKAKGNLITKLEEGYDLLDTALNIETVSLSYDKKADEEAEKIIGSITVKVSTLSYLKEDLKAALKDKISELVPGNFSLVLGDKNLVVTSSSKEMIFNKTTGDLESILVSSKVQSAVSPKIDLEKVSEDIQKKQIQDAQSYLSEIANITSAKIIISPNIPLFNKRLPNKSKISIELEITDGTEGQ